MEQTTNTNGEIVLSDYITIKVYDFISAKDRDVYISAFYYHGKDSLPCELLEVKEDLTLEEIYGVRNDGMYNISRKYKDYQFQNKETIELVARSILPKEMKKWIKFEQCRSINIKVHYPDSRCRILNFTLKNED
ncbi:hypothetical protein [Carboxylicivirga sp. RSCT41]|uniref:hypothetical protein n=1 Tax=Carboxylicivirga agarovorans TaxID=3417570 RepID=UPI003D34CE0C